MSDPDAGAPCLPADAGAPGRSTQIKPLALTDGEINDLVEFLKTLTGGALAGRADVEAGGRQHA